MHSFNIKCDNNSFQVCISSLINLKTYFYDHLRSFMEINMEKTMSLLSNIMPLIACINSDVAEHLER
jgi:hypothetical protein